MYARRAAISWRATTRRCVTRASGRNRVGRVSGLAQCFANFLQVDGRFVVGHFDLAVRYVDANADDSLHGIEGAFDYPGTVVGGNSGDIQGCESQVVGSFVAAFRGFTL